MNNLQVGNADASAQDFLSVIIAAFRKEALKKLVFSRPLNSEVQKISGRLCSHRGRRLLALEYSLPGNTVSHKNLAEDELEATITQLIGDYKQVNLITALGDAERKISKSGSAVNIGIDKLRRRFEGEAPAFEKAIEALDKQKNYLLTGKETFLISLGISDKTGRVHDKKQGKFRQINRFLEHINDIYSELPKDNEIKIYDLCCGKSYLSFAVYYYLTEVKCRTVKMLGIDLKRDVIEWCSGVAKELGYDGMTFVCDDVTNTPKDESPDMVISLHACDIATDIVINSAISLGAKVILSTPCCHRYLNDKVTAKSLRFITDHPQLRNKLCEAATDAIRLLRLKASGYRAVATELTDPENTPKNTLLIAIREECAQESVICERKAEYDAVLKFLLGDEYVNYLSNI